MNVKQIQTWADEHFKHKVVVFLKTRNGARVVLGAEDEIEGPFYLQVQLGGVCVEVSPVTQLLYDVNWLSGFKEHVDRIFKGELLRVASAIHPPRAECPRCKGNGLLPFGRYGEGRACPDCRGTGGIRPASSGFSVEVDVDVEGVVYHTTVPHYLANVGRVIDWPIERENGDLTVIEVPILKVYPPRDAQQVRPSDDSPAAELVKKEFKYYCRGLGIDPASVTWKDFPRLTANEPSSFANWYALYAMPLGIDRENARLIYELAVKEHQQAVIDAMSLYNERLERIETAFVVLYEKWLAAGHRRDMNEAMEAMARALGKPICPDCKRELVKPGNTCSQCDRPPDMTDNIIHSSRMRIPGA